MSKSLKPEKIVSAIMRYGVICSISVVMIGLAWSFIDLNQSLFTNGVFETLTRGDLLQTISQKNTDFSAASVIALGTVMLIALPVISATSLFVVYSIKKDRIYSLISFSVLIILILALLLGSSL